MPRRMPSIALLVSLCFAAAPAAMALDAFDRHALPQLRELGNSGMPLTELSARQAAELKLLGPGFTSPAIVIKTDGGNWAKALVSWGLRKTADKPVPVLMLDRYVTFDATRPGVTLARGKDVMLFGGFGYDFDIGQVVPAGQGADIEFAADRKLRPAGTAQLFGLDGPRLPDAPPDAEYDPTDHEGVVPQDFSGAWRLDADGRWQGLLELKVDAKGNVDGQYVSDDTQSAYKVIGRADAALHRIVLEIELVNSAQLFEGFLWTTNKSMIAGVTTLTEQKFGFVATRQSTAADASGSSASSATGAGPAPAAPAAESIPATDRP